MPQFNTDEYEERGPIQVPAGQYPFAVVEAKEAMSKAGNEMINLELQFEVGAEKPMTIYDRLVFTAKALFRIKQFTEATGTESNWADGALDAEDCIGLEGIARIALGDKNDKGKQYMEVDWYAKPGGFAEAPTLSPAKQAKLDKARESVSSGSAVAPDLGVLDDDIPF